MVIKQNVPVRELTTIRVGAPTSVARVVITATSESELLGALLQVRQSGLPYRVLGWGSNVVGRDDGFNGIVIINKLGGFKVLDESESGARIWAGAGESLDTVVALTVEMGLTGIECLSSIPGTAGAAPVQNAGAYGQEIGDCLESVQAIDTTTMESVTLTWDDCDFAYRDSVFKHNDRRYIITGIIVALTRDTPKPPFYKSLHMYLDAHQITEYTPSVIRDAVIAIRKDRLPSPMLLPNAGSFFKNVVVPQAKANELQASYADLPVYPSGEGTAKLPAAWLIEQAGFKGVAHGPVRSYDKNALVLVNDGAATYADLAELRAQIQRGVNERFGVQLEQEPEELAA